MRPGGFGGACLEAAQSLALAGKCVASVALPDELIGHASRAKLLERFGLGAEGLANTVREVRATWLRSRSARAG